jgi:hypothetical protein
MRFFFPDSQDQIDPSFDFEAEERSETRVRQRDDLYAHEALDGAPYDGVLVSKAIVDGLGGASRYTFAQRHRLYRVGIRRFFRLDRPELPPMETLGDCGAFTYVNEEVPPYTVDEVIDFYEGCGFDLGISVDHVILGYLDASEQIPGVAEEVPDEWPARQEITIELAGEFWRRVADRRCRLTPLGVAQGWDPASYSRAVQELQQMGYSRIALGGMVPLKTREILRCLAAIDDVRDPTTQLHLLGVTRTEHVSGFAAFGVTSFDSTSPFRQAFKDNDHNFHTFDRDYTAIRVPQVDGNARLKREILAGKIHQGEAIALERRCLDVLAAFDGSTASAGDVLDAVDEYDAHLGVASRRQEYADLLAARPWKDCPCGICADAGIQAAIFRGTERNKRRGFHNLYVFRQRLDHHVATGRTSRKEST